MKLTGERPIEGKTPSGLLALHAAGYREVVARLNATPVHASSGGSTSPARLLDLGCGLGDGSANFLAEGRTVVGLDYHAETAAAAMRRHPGLVTTCSDGTRLSLKSRSFKYVCSSHLIEHFTDPTPHVAELARVVADDGEVMVLTPNKPADFENPYHLYLFEPDDLFNMLGRYFHEVTVYGLDGDAAVKADFARRRAFANRMLKIDILNLRKRLPRAAYVALHAGARRVAYPLLAAVNRRKGAAAEPIVTADQFRLTTEIDDTTLVLFAVARRPR
jgi:ubiquinone/menaquinone biosynthesis C-methylase UbiE